MNLMKHNLVHRGLAEYKAGLLSLLGRIMGRGKGYTSRGGQQLPPWDQKIISSRSWWQEYHIHNLENRVEFLTKFWLHPPPLGPLCPMMYPPTGWGERVGKYIFQGPRLTPLNAITQGGVPDKILVTGCGALYPPPMHTSRHRGTEGVDLSG